MKGQALVEFALVLPILMLMLLGFGEAAMLFATRQGYQNGADVMAQWAASEMAEKPGESWKSGWNKVVNDEQARADCDADPAISFPDGGHLPGDRVLVRWSCRYTPRLSGPIAGLTVTVDSEAVVPGVLLPPSPSVSPSG